MEDYVENKGKRQIFLKPKKMQEALKDIFKNKIKLIKKKVWYTKKCTCKCKKKERLSEKGVKKIAKM